MKILGTSTVLATGTTKFTDASAVWVQNTDASNSHTVVIRNADDNADIGSIAIGAMNGIVVHLEIGEGLRGPVNLYGTHVDSGSGR